MMAPKMAPISTIKGESELRGSTLSRKRDETENFSAVLPDRQRRKYSDSEIKNDIVLMLV